MKTYQKQTDPMNQTYKSLPIIDIQPFINGSARRNVADQVIEACKEIGFLIIKGHEIEETVINDAFNASKSFFDLPQNIKNKWHPNEPSLQRGYHAFATRGLSYTLGEDTPPDLRETYFMGPIDDHSRHFQDVVSAQKAYAPNILPGDEIDLGVRLINLYRSFEDLSAILLKVFALGLDVHEDYFLKLAKRHFSILSSHNYPPLTKNPKKDQLRTGAHTDFGAITILAIKGNESGLEVLMPDGHWLGVNPPDGCLVVNLGDMMNRWTNGLWKSTLHRVANPQNLNSINSHRQTLGYFMHPDFDALIEVIPSCIARGTVAEFAPIMAGEHIAEKIRASHEGKNNP